MPPRFVASVPYDPTHPRALAVYCSDGRFTAAVEELLHELGHPRLDVLSLPGGPALLGGRSVTPDGATAVTEAAAFLIHGHHIEETVLLAHAGCGFYRARYPGADEAALLHRQREDLRDARAALAASHPAVGIHLFFARVALGRVAFDPVE